MKKIDQLEELIKWYQRNRKRWSKNSELIYEALRAYKKLLNKDLFK